MSHGIYPPDFAEMLKPRAGEKYQPSNGTEGTIFMSSWCEHCARDKSMSEGKNFDECSEDEVCKIIGDTMMFKVEDEEYPKEWQYGKDGQPCCTAFAQAGQPVPLRDDLTMDLFGGNHE